MNLDPRVRTWLKYSGFVAFYLFALFVFCFLTFPYQRLRDRVVEEFNARQTGPDPLRLELDELSGYWVGGVEAEGIRLISAPKPNATSSTPGEPPKPSVLEVESAHASVSLLGLLFGSLDLDFGAAAFGGTISGETSESDGTRSLDLTLEDLSLSQAPLLADAIGLPLGGTVQGELELVLPEGKLAKADGKVSIEISELSVGDGKAKIRETIALPKVEAGDLKLEGDVSEGQFKVAEFAAKGSDLEFVSEGSIRLRDPLASSLLSLTARFRFTDRYANKNDLTRALLGTPGSSAPGLFDLDPKNKRAKRPDGYYGYRVSGSMSAPSFAPNASAGGSGSKDKAVKGE